MNIEIKLFLQSNNSQIDFGSLRQMLFWLFLSTWLDLSAGCILDLPFSVPPDVICSATHDPLADYIVYIFPSHISGGPAPGLSRCITRPGSASSCVTIAQVPTCVDPYVVNSTTPQFAGVCGPVWYEAFNVFLFTPPPNPAASITLQANLSVGSFIPTDIQPRGDVLWILARQGANASLNMYDRITQTQATWLPNFHNCSYGLYVNANLSASNIWDSVVLTYGHQMCIHTIVSGNLSTAWLDFAPDTVLSVADDGSTLDQLKLFCLSTRYLWYLEVNLSAWSYQATLLRDMSISAPYVEPTKIYLRSPGNLVLWGSRHVVWQYQLEINRLSILYSYPDAASDNMQVLDVSQSGIIFVGHATVHKLFFDDNVCLSGALPVGSPWQVCLLLSIGFLLSAMM